MQANFQSCYQTIVKAPVEKVWDALTNPAKVKQYFFGSNLETDWEVGSPIHFNGEYEGKTYQDKGVVQEFKPNETLSYSYFSSWSGMPELDENYLLVRYKLTPVSEGTQLEINQTNYDQEKAKHSEENWAVIVDGLKKLVEQP